MYRTDLENLIKRIINDFHPSSYDEIFQHAGGAFPDVVYEIASQQISFPQKNEHTEAPQHSLLPVPNPSNFDWRFDNKTIDYLITMVNKQQYQRIALFGTPSLFLPLSQLSKDVVLFDINELLGEVLCEDKRIINVDIDLVDPEIYEKFDCIIMDPPWYLSYYNNWIQKANEMLVNGGLLLTTLFQPYLRPDAAEELFEIRKLAEAGGLTDKLRNAVTYNTPAFEKSIFEEQQIPVIGNWRSADLLMLIKSKETQHPIIPLKRELWDQILIAGKVVAIRKEHSKEAITAIEPYKNKTLLLSVSNRDPVKRQVNLITSDNHGLIITGTSRVSRFLKELAHGVEKESLYQTLNINQSEQKFLNKILNLIIQ